MDTLNHGLGTIDYVIFGIYVLVIISVGLAVSRKNKQSTEGYFLAGKSLPWWAVGASLIAANISAEQFIGMSGSGFVIGLGIASYRMDGCHYLDYRCKILPAGIHRQRHLHYS